MLQVRPLQKELHEHWSLRTGHPRDIILVVACFVQVLSWWTERYNMMTAVGFWQAKPQIQMFSDASITGWRGRVELLEVGDDLTEAEKAHHINVLEFLPVRKVLQSVKRVFSNKSVLIGMDNSRVVNYTQKRGGPRSQTAFHSKHKFSQLSGCFTHKCVQMSAKCGTNILYVYTCLPQNPTRWMCMCHLC